MRVVVEFFFIVDREGKIFKICASYLSLGFSIQNTLFRFGVSVSVGFF